MRSHKEEDRNLGWHIGSAQSTVVIVIGFPQNGTTQDEKSQQNQWGASVDGSGVSQVCPD